MIIFLLRFLEILVNISTPSFSSVYRSCESTVLVEIVLIFARKLQPALAKILAHHYSENLPEFVIKI